MSAAPVPGEGTAEPEWTRADHDARTDRLRPLADHLRLGHDVLPELRRYQDTWLHIALLAEEWFAAHTAPAADPGLCSQCGERSSAMVKVGTSDGWCTQCLDEAADRALAERVAALADEWRADWNTYCTHAADLRALLGESQ